MTNNCETMPVQTTSKRKTPPKDTRPPPTTVETTQPLENLIPEPIGVCDNPAPPLTVNCIHFVPESIEQNADCSIAATSPGMSMPQSTTGPPKCPSTPCEFAALKENIKNNNQNEAKQNVEFTATIIPPAMSKIKSVVVPTKCPAITLAYEKEQAVFKVFARMLQLYKANQIMFSFNGGKDCTVALHMLHKFYQNHALSHLQLPVLYIQSEDAFPQIDKFVEDCTKRYNVVLIKRQGGIKEILQEVLSEMPHIKAVVMGNRSTDPYCDKLNVFQVTDPDWPPLMRVNPILDWTYSDVWTYIFVYRVPYCSLYECGYTSIGGMGNTQPNPSLKRIDEVTGETKYLPAYELTDASLERAGRIRTNTVNDL